MSALSFYIHCISTVLNDWKKLPPPQLWCNHLHLGHSVYQFSKHHPYTSCVLGNSKCKMCFLLLRVFCDLCVTSPLQSSLKSWMHYCYLNSYKAKWLFMQNKINCPESLDRLFSLDENSAVWNSLIHGKKWNQSWKNSYTGKNSEVFPRISGFCLFRAQTREIWKLFQWLLFSIWTPRNLEITLSSSLVYFFQGWYSKNSLKISLKDRNCSINGKYAVSGENSLKLRTSGNHLICLIIFLMISFCHIPIMNLKYSYMKNIATDEKQKENSYYSIGKSLYHIWTELQTSSSNPTPPRWISWPVLVKEILQRKLSIQVLIQHTLHINFTFQLSVSTNTIFILYPDITRPQRVSE